MTKHDFEVNLLTAIKNNLPTKYSSLLFIAGNQEQSQGREDGIYFYPLDIPQRGWLKRVYDYTSETMKEVQMVERTYQFSAFIDDGLDVISQVRASISGLNIAEALAKKGIGIQRPSDIFNPVRVNDKDQYEHNPNFTITFTHPMEFNPEVVYTDDIEFTGIHRV